MSTRFSSTLRKALPLAKSAPIVLLGLIVAAFLAAPVYAGYGIVENAASATGFAQASDPDPEANLPFLFAVYILTWAGFFRVCFLRVTPPARHATRHRGAEEGLTGA